MTEEIVFTRTIGREEMHPRFLEAYPNIQRATIGYTAADLEEILGVAWRAAIGGAGGHDVPWPAELAEPDCLCGQEPAHPVDDAHYGSWIG